MICFVLLTVLVFASKTESNESVAANSGERIMQNEVKNSIVVKIEEDEYVKKKSKSSNYFGVSRGARSKWVVFRWSKMKLKDVFNGNYKDEETAGHASDTLARKLMANGEQDHKLNFPDDDTEVYPEKKTTGSKYFGISYNQKIKQWVAQRWSKTEKKLVKSGWHKNEITAAHASDGLARKLMENGETDHKLNFPDDYTEVQRRTKSSKYFGVSYNEKLKRWFSQRWSKTEKKSIIFYFHKDEVTAAHASDTLAKQLMANGEHNHKLNFPDDNTELQRRTKSSKYFGVSYNEKMKRWFSQRWSRMEKKSIISYFHKDEVTAAHASDTLAIKLMENGEHNHKLNFPDENTDEHPEQQNNKRKRTFENNLERLEEKEK